jgi:hypothetical protein
MIVELKKMLLLIPTIVAVLFSASIAMTTTSVYSQGTEGDTQEETGTEGSEGTEETEGTEGDTQEETGTEGSEGTEVTEGTEGDTQEETEANGQVLTAELSGENEVPATESNATGVADFQLSTGDDEQEVGYSVNLTGFDDITAAHIHSGSEGDNGPIVVTLSSGAEAEDDSDEIQLNGDITAADLEGPLEDSEITDLVDLLNNGSAYVNVHTEIYPDGAIRGQIGSGESPSSNASSSSTGVEPSPSVP